MNKPSCGRSLLQKRTPLFTASRSLSSTGHSFKYVNSMMKTENGGIKKFCMSVSGFFANRYLYSVPKL